MDECIGFLQWALPRLGLRWAGYRKVRRQVCRRVRRRIAELDLRTFGDYRRHLEDDPDEWAVLDRLTQVTISRFYRDRGVFDGLRAEVLPALAERATDRFSVWSAGAAGGEEAYTIALAWNLELAASFPHLRLSVLATDIDDAMLERAHTGCYGHSSLKDLPERWRRDGFTDASCVRPEHRQPVTLLRHDIRDAPPGGDFDLVLCRYLAFTYFDDGLQQQVARALAAALRPGGGLVIGTHETFPADVGLEPWPGRRWTYRRARPRG